MRRCTGLAGFLTGLLIVCTTLVRAQGLYPVSTDEKVNRSSLILEGKVISQRSAWNSRHTMIYTTSTVEVYKLFKGNLEKNLVEVVTIGGAVDGYYIHASHLLELHNDELGIFFLNRQSVPGITPPSGTTFGVYSSSQGFLKYDVFSKTASAPFVSYSDIEHQLYNDLNNRIGRKVEIKNPYFSLDKEAGRFQSNNSILAPVITGFSPATVSAGALLDPVNNELTITGTGFGTASGSAAVLFSDADFAAGTQFTAVPYNSRLIISWSATQIRVRVPTQAGSGTFRVRDNAGEVVNSPAPLDVRYSILTADFGGSYGIKQFNLGNMNGSGGYSVKYSITTANNGVNIDASPAKATFQRALNTWKETVGVNFVEAGTSTLQLVDPDDNENLIMYDNGGTGLDGPLGDGVLATCFSGITICTNNPAANQARKTGFDIVIRNTGYSSGNTPFTLGPCPPYSQSSSVVDLESVLLHELGHALNLGHIVDPLQGSGAGTATPAKVMHYSVSFNQRRISLDYSAKAGGEYQATPRSHTYGNCVTGEPEMTPLTPVLEAKDECPATFPVAAIQSPSTINFDLVHSTSNKFTDPSFTQMRTDGNGTNITNTAFYAFRTGNIGGNLALEIRNYTTSPTSIAACPVGGTGIPVTGVKMSIYNVPSCPEGGEFPTPISYSTFSGNGQLAGVTGLTANTNYLVVVDGIQNTKAVFDVVFSGSAFPTQQTDLNGEILDNSNRLVWTTDPSFDLVDLRLERSSDGVEFGTIHVITGDEQSGGEFSDDTPLPGTNYYRLRLENGNGDVQFSEVVLLNRTDFFDIKITPYPAGQQINVEITSIEPGRYGLTVQNALGQKIVTRQVNVNTRRHIEVINSSAFMSGVYYIAVFDSNNKRIKAATIKIN
jgi:hypothetical protein